MNETSLPRTSGILLHPTSLPSPYGIGDLGRSAYEFIDFLAQAGQHLWQVLPLTHTGFGDSPYQSFSAFAGQPLLISPAYLQELQLVSQDDLNSCPTRRSDTGRLRCSDPLEKWSSPQGLSVFSRGTCFSPELGF